MGKIREARHPLEYVAFLDLQMNTKEGPAFLFFAIDAFTGHAFNLGVEQELNQDTILKHIYFLCEHPEFVEVNSSGFTLVLEYDDQLSENIAAIIKPENGKVLFDKTFHNFITNPFLAEMNQYLRAGLNN